MAVDLLLDAVQLFFGTDVQLASHRRRSCHDAAVQFIGGDQLEFVTDSDDKSLAVPIAKEQMTVGKDW